MSTDPHAADDSGHDHGDDHGHDEDAHGVDDLGPIDVPAWGAGIAGVAIAIVMAACFALATSGLA